MSSGCQPLPNRLPDPLLLSRRQTELIGYRHETYVLKQQHEQLKGQELDELDVAELEKLLATIEEAHGLIAAQEADWVTKQLAYYDSEIQFALAEEDFERAAVLKKQRNQLREAEGIEVGSPKSKKEEEEVPLEDDDL